MLPTHLRGRRFLLLALAAVVLVLVLTDTVAAAEFAPAASDCVEGGSATTCN